MANGIKKMGPDYILEGAASRREVFSVFSVKLKKTTVFPGRVNERRRWVAAGGGLRGFTSESGGYEQSEVTTIRSVVDKHQ